MRAIINANVIMDNNVFERYSVLFDEKIRKIGEDTSISTEGAGEITDARGRYLSPGFIDLHIHGCNGSDTMDDNDDSIRNISRSLVRTGVTSFLPTTLTMDLSAIEGALDRIRELMDHGPGAEILGCHLEGPFINKEYKGAQEARYIQTPDFSKIERFLDVIKIITLAPEYQGSGEFIENCLKHGIVASMGHTGAGYEQAMEAIEKGAGHITHTFNAMSPLHHRDPGVVGAAMDSSVSCELIADNIHVHPAAQRILLKAKGIEKIILVTDAMKACMLKDGVYNLGGHTVIVRGDEARLRSGKLASSVLTMNKALKNFRANTGISIADAVRTAASNPAEVLGIGDRKGSIKEGKDADMVIFDDSFNVYETFVKGKRVYCTC